MQKFNFFKPVTLDQQIGKILTWSEAQNTVFTHRSPIVLRMAYLSYLDSYHNA